MLWIYNNEKPQDVEISHYCGQRQRRINYDVEELGEGDYSHRYKQATLPPGEWNYESIVNAIVSAEYPTDKMQAVVNNYLLDMEKGKEEFEQMQKCRAKAKAIAKHLLESGVR